MKAYFIQYKFVLPQSIKHSSYTYQKLFRAIYGYTQNVCKANGKTYKYHRQGVLSDVPFLKNEKNSVIIPQSAFPKLLEFFKTGKNPTHNWTGKGDWKAVYYMSEKDIQKKDISKAVEELLERSFISSNEEGPAKLEDEVYSVIKQSSSEKADKGRVSMLLSECQKIISSEWFREALQESEKAKKFNQAYLELKNL